MTGTDMCVNKPHKSRSYLNHPVEDACGLKVNIYGKKEKETKLPYKRMFSCLPALRICVNRPVKS